MSIRLTFLGTGTSHGVPMIACRAKACRSFDPHDKRTRSSALLQWNYDGQEVAVLIDTTPELRVQTLACRVDRVDAVLITHHHADHIMGLDDIRRYNDHQGQHAMPLYAEPDCMAHLNRIFPYAIDRGQGPRTPGRPLLQCHPIWPGVPFELFGQAITPLRLMHGKLPVLGFRIGRLAYCTDVGHIPPESWPLLENLDVLVLDGLRHAPHDTHFSLSEAVAVVERCRPRQAYFTHIAHDLIHAKINAELPPGMALAYDGLVVEIQESRNKMASVCISCLPQDADSALQCPP